MVMRWPIVVVVALVACSSDEGKVNIHRDRDRDRPHRIIEPPSGIVRPLPPHAIRAEGVGPYKLGDRLDTQLDALPSGPYTNTFSITNLLHRSLIRAEDDTVLIGGPEPTGTATFVAVIDAEVARTESGIHVGSTRRELDRALGPPIEELDHVRDPRVLVGATMSNLEVIVENDRATALVITTDARKQPDEVPGALRVRPVRNERGFGACLLPVPLAAVGSAGSGSAAPPPKEGEIVVVAGDEISVEQTDGTKLASLHVPNLVYAAALRNLADGRDELVAITRIDEPAQRTWSLTGFRLDGKLVRSIEPTVLYQLSGTNARLNGGELRDFEIYMELTARPEAIEVGGLLTIGSGGKLRYVMTISSTVVRRRPKSANPPGEVVPGDAGLRDRDAEIPDTHPSGSPP